MLISGLVHIWAIRTLGAVREWALAISATLGIWKKMVTALKVAGHVG